ncbi:MAG: hypothetical protein ACFFFC_01015 [Candidatus Thorarchaeota archaeon]
MEQSLIKILLTLSTYGPGFAVAGIFIALFLLERKKSEKMAEKLQELAVDSIRADLEHTKAYKALERVFDNIIKIISSRGD